MKEKNLFQQSEIIKTESGSYKVTTYLVFMYDLRFWMRKFYVNFKVWTQYTLLTFKKENKGV